MLNSLVHDFFWGLKHYSMIPRNQMYCLYPLGTYSTCSDPWLFSHTIFQSSFRLVSWFCSEFDVGSLTWERRGLAHKILRKLWSKFIPNLVNMHVWQNFTYSNYPDIFWNERITQVTFELTLACRKSPRGFFLRPLKCLCNVVECCSVYNFCLCTFKRNNDHWNRITIGDFFVDHARALSWNF